MTRLICNAVDPQGGRPMGPTLAWSEGCRIPEKPVVSILAITPTVIMHFISNYG
jgi:hypothetical protein